MNSPRWTFLLILSFLGLMSSKGWGQAAEIPCPIDQIVKETREHNQKQGRNLPESFYQGLRENYLDQCRIANQAIAELTPKLKEYEAGKRDERDGYVILQKLNNQYEVLKANDTPAARDVKGKRDALANKHPDYPSMQDFRLSEELLAEQKRQQEQAKAAKETMKWSPPDTQAIGFFGSQNFMVVQYQFRIEFYKLPKDVYFENLGGGANIIKRANNGSTAPISLDQLVPYKILTFKRRFEVRPRNVLKHPNTDLLVCSIARESWYIPRTSEEEKMIEIRGYHERAIPWINDKGRFDDFCGIIARTGDILFQFPYSQKKPDRLLEPWRST